MRFIRVLLPITLIALVFVPSALALRFTDESYFPPVGTVGQPYYHKFDGTGGCGPGLPYQYRVLNGSLPSGLTLSSAGVVSGIPTGAGKANVWIELSDQNPPTETWCRVETAEREFTFQIVQGLSVQQQTVPSPAFINEPYSFQLTASGGGTQTWSIASGTPPPGITLSAGGLLSGTPTTVGDRQFVVKVADGTRSDTETFILIVAQRLTIVPVTVPPAEVSMPFFLDVNAVGGREPQSWSLAGDLPSGLTFNPTTGQITGTPAVTGSFLLKLTVTDALRLSAQVDVTLVVAAKLAIVTKKLRAAKEDKRYRNRIVTLGGIAPKAFELIGTAPPGLRLNTATGVLAGIPKDDGTFKLKIEVTDRLGAKAKVTLVLTVAAKLAIATKKLKAAKEGKRYSARIVTANGVSPKAYKLRGKLPPGLTFNTRTGVLSGTPTQAGTFRLTFEVTDRLGAKAKATLVLKVLGA